MDKYIQQLIEDLQQAAKNPPKPFYFETPPVFDDDPSMAELSMVPYKTIEELTGIKQEAFPHINNLHCRHWRGVLDAIFEVLDSLLIKLIDAPKGMPKEWLYDTITSNWHHPVQYLPMSGMDLEFCTGDPMNCPYGDFCDCDHEWPDDEEFFELEREIPECYEALIPEMVETIESGLVCFLFTDTLELKKIPQAVCDDPEEFGTLIGINDKEGSDEINIWGDHFAVEPLLRFELENMMEDFINQLLNDTMQTKLFEALNSKNRAERFNSVVLKSAEKQNWLNYKQSWLEQHVRAIIWQDLRNSSIYGEELNGFFNDDGSRIDPGTVPTPSLCMLCKSFYIGDPEEDMLCLLNRNDQRDEPDFKCGAFKKIE
ncbi:MAG: UPF0158 family protein [Prolixibacteraceae bacterium]|jgi:hypothetical protein|nr:UPF0158 family protein [Prolixibacteraceae bacterium]